MKYGKKQQLNHSRKSRWTVPLLLFSLLLNLATAWFTSREVPLASFFISFTIVAILSTRHFVPIVVLKVLVTAVTALSLASLLLVYYWYSKDSGSYEAKGCSSFFGAAVYCASNYNLAYTLYSMVSGSFAFALLILIGYGLDAQLHKKNIEKSSL